jgi:hypothetical protein
MKKNKTKQVATALLGSLSVMSASSELLYAATKDQASPQVPSQNSAQETAIPAHVAAGAALSPEIAILPANDQVKLQQSLSNLQEQYGDDLINRMIFKYEDGQLKVIGIRQESAEALGSKPSSM